MPLSTERIAALRGEILGILNGIIDPCSAATAVPAGLVDMGLIRSLKFDPLGEDRWRCSVQLCVTHAFCMMTGVFVNEIDQRLQAHAQLDEVRVDLDYSTIWTEELMSPDYRTRLHAHRTAQFEAEVKEVEAREKPIGDGHVDLRLQLRMGSSLKGAL